MKDNQGKSQKTERRGYFMRRTKKILWGLAFLLAAALLIAGNFFDLDMRVSDILIMIAMVLLLIEGIVHQNYALILFPIAVMLIVNSDRLGMAEISPWSVLAAALLGSIGLSVLFPRRGRHWRISENGSMDGVWKEKGKGIQEEIIQEGSGEKVRLENSFSSTAKYFNGVMPRKVRLENSFGSMAVYFDNAVMQDHEVHVRVDASFGSMVLYVPSTWKVVLRTDVAFGSVKEEGQCNPDGEEVMEIKVMSSFGEVKIKYI